MACNKCGADGWVCENHPNKPWPDVCDCGAGMICSCTEGPTLDTMFDSADAIVDDFPASDEEKLAVMPEPRAIEQLEARELDVLVAEKIFHIPSFVIHDEPHGKVVMWEGRECHVAANARYSADPAASKQLRYKMREEGWCWKIETAMGGYTVIMWKGRHAPDTWADTEERAVALAALKAKGITHA